VRRFFTTAYLLSLVFACGTYFPSVFFSAYLGEIWKSSLVSIDELILKLAWTFSKIIADFWFF